jgi:hypothetical protein
MKRIGVLGGAAKGVSVFGGADWYPCNDPLVMSS